MGALLSVSDHDAIKAVVSQQLRAARVMRGMSLRRASGSLGISASYLSQIEVGKRNLPIELLFGASRLYGVSVDVLLGRDELPGKNRGAKVVDVVRSFFSPVKNSARA